MSDVTAELSYMRTNQYHGHHKDNINYSMSDCAANYPEKQNYQGLNGKVSMDESLVRRLNIERWLQEKQLESLKISTENITSEQARPSSVSSHEKELLKEFDNGDLGERVNDNTSENVDLHKILSSEISADPQALVSPVEESTKELFERVVVYVRKSKHSPYKKADFSICLLDYFNIDDTFGEIGMSFANKHLYLEIPDKKHVKNSVQIYSFEHPFFCSVHRITQEQRDELPQEIANRGIDVGVSVILESADEKILVTHRAPHMRTFPGVWVSPGGHIAEGDESLLDAGLRELYEETGLHFENTAIKHSHVLGLWESVFPAVLYEGKPKRHHVVVYILVQVNAPSNILQNLLELEPEEVDGSVWLTKDLISIVVYGGIDMRYFCNNHSQSKDIPMTIVSSDGSQQLGKFDPQVLRRKMPAQDRIVERISTGTRFAAKLWLKWKNKSSFKRPQAQSLSDLLSI